MNIKKLLCCIGLFVMLDSTLVSDNLKESDNKMLPDYIYKLGTAENFAGIDRIFYKKRYKNLNCFSEDDKKDLVKMLVQNPSTNKTLINEKNTIIRNCQTVNKTKMPKDLPILKFIAIASMKDVNNEKNTAIINKNLNEYKEYNKFNYRALEGQHFIYYTKSQEIGKETREFLSKYDN